MSKLFEDLDYAKKSVCYMLDNENGCVDFHGITYWASEVERLRAEIKKQL